MMLQERVQRGDGRSVLTLKAEAGYDVPIAAIRPTTREPQR
jgi:hypothetical protein